jgi:hypothetical protein
MAPWFRRKRWGYGWTPASWEAWVATLLVVLACMGIADPELAHLDQVMRLVCILALVACFLAIVLATSERKPDS